MLGSLWWWSKFRLCPLLSPIRKLAGIFSVDGCGNLVSKKRNQCPMLSPIRKLVGIFSVDGCSNLVSKKRNQWGNIRLHMINGLCSLVVWSLTKFTVNEDFANFEGSKSYQFYCVRWSVIPAGHNKCSLSSSLCYQSSTQIVVFNIYLGKRYNRVFFDNNELLSGIK